ncbi:TonB family protein [Stenotrophomonas mori]|uniref:Energy transducer TonB n=1 Tax=Stenotrophomonas mori TaxID=2871096 RepID=A0ABT0SGJ5_9GAMM|nr:TonB family protein [Stenotrophomonas mori]MCL7714437.1 energy transducer TonB [Stenotrophomonas mori]
MAGRRANRGWLAALLLAVPPVHATQVEQPLPVDAGCPPFSAQDNRAPSYPPSELWRLLGYAVDIVIQADACGRVTDTVVERSSGVATLDETALAAARGWTVPPSARGQPRYRLPFAFQPLPPEVATQAGRRPPDPFFDERSSGRVPAPPVAADGALPGYLPDPYPIGYMYIPEAVAAIGPLALFRRYGPQAHFWLRDEEGVSLFQTDGTMMVRNRLVDDGRQRFVVTSVLCGSDLEACRRSLADLRDRRGPQRPQPLP